MAFGEVNIGGDGSQKHMAFCLSAIVMIAQMNVANVMQNNS